MKLIALFLLTLALTGCGDLTYRGNAPNVRTFSEEPSLSQYYIGWDIEFALTDPPAAGADPEVADEIREPQLPVDNEDLPRELPEPRFLN